ncbi:MAG: hypothetical protein U9N30_02625 [Campylobacterota bacterium]|nr:hypothetical protein [Campylobacterota bacterium]
MYFVFNDAKQLIFYIVVILTGIVLEYFGIADVEKVIAVGIFAGLVLYVVKTILFGQCTQCPKGSKKDSKSEI